MDPEPRHPEQRVRSYGAEAETEADTDTDVSRDDADVGWGEIPVARAARDAWYLAERPPHHG